LDITKLGLSNSFGPVNRKFGDSIIVQKIT